MQLVYKFLHHPEEGASTPISPLFALPKVLSPKETNKKSNENGTECSESAPFYVPPLNTVWRLPAECESSVMPRLAVQLPYASMIFDIDDVPYIHVKAERGHKRTIIRQKYDEFTAFYRMVSKLIDSLPDTNEVRHFLQEYRLRHPLHREDSRLLHPLRREQMPMSSSKKSTPPSTPSSTKLDGSFSSYVVKAIANKERTKSTNSRHLVSSGNSNDVDADWYPATFCRCSDETICRLNESLPTKYVTMCGLEIIVNPAQLRFVTPPDTCLCKDLSNNNLLPK